jgi:hypothetical protein
MADCGDQTFVVPDKDKPTSFRCVPVGLEVLDPSRGCVFKAARPLTCVSATIGFGEMVCHNGVLFADGTLGFFSSTNTGCPLSELPPGAVEQPGANPVGYPVCP